MGIKARTLGFDLDGMKVDVEKIMKQGPRRVGGINLVFEIPEHLRQLDEKTKEDLKTIGKACPVQQSINPEIEVNIDWNW
jgi:uncharacterized OsmC-like protein